MSGKHTPGPWLAAGKHITQDDGGVIAYTTAYAKPTPRQLADARLIAAAPDLLEALQEVLKHEKWHAAVADEVTPAARAAIRKADAVIAKATGEAA
jgi:ATP:corrinoid adenosyltransferase